MTKRTWITVTAALALLCTVGCEKKETTSPDASPPDADVEPAEPEEPEEPKADEPSVLSKASFDETITDHFEDVSNCYVSALETNAELAGKLDAEFTFGADGVVTSIVVADGSSLNDEALVQCITEAAQGWGFDKPSADGMTLRYEFNLAPG